jgi:hypothetical protein
MEKELVEELIKKYLQGKASLEEINQLEQWYDSIDSSLDLYFPGSIETNQVMDNGFSDLKLKLGIS